MQAATRHRRDLLVALVVAALALAAIWYAYPMLQRRSGEDPIQAAWERREQLRAATEARSVATAPAAVPTAATPPMPAPAPADACGFAPALPPGAADDGLFSPSAAMRIPQPGGAGPFLEVGREAAAQGRLRDAESAFIVACRLQARAGDDPARLADIRVELARHYVEAARQNPGAANEAILARASQLLDGAAQSDGMFATPAVAKARQVRADLAALQAGTLGAAGDPAQERPPELAMRGPDASAIGQPEAAEPARGVAAATLVAQDAELAQLDADLQRLRAQARSVTDHPAAFQRRDEAARARRDACGDRACLLRWYASRRSELIDEF